MTHQQTPRSWPAVNILAEGRQRANAPSTGAALTIFVIDHERRSKERTGKVTPDRPTAGETTTALTTWPINQRPSCKPDHLCIPPQ